MHIRTRLLLLVLSILVPALLAAALAVWFVYAEQQEAQKKGMAETARALALLIDNELQTTEGILRALATSDALETKDFKSFYEQAQRLAPPAYSAVVLTDQSGNQILNTRLPFGADLTGRHTPMKELRKQAGPEQTIVSDLFFARLANQYEFAVQIPVKLGNETRYYLAMGISAARLNNLFAQQNLPHGWLGVIIDRNGTVIARTEQAETYVGKLAREGLRRKILGGERAGVHYGLTLDGRPTAGFFSRANMSGWTVVINIPTKEIRRPAIYAAAFLGGVMLVLLGLAIVAARWYAGKTVKPIEGLQRAAEALGRGEELTVLPTGLIETDLVGHALTNASQQIRQNKANLELQIAEAVAVAERAQRALLQGQKLEALGRLSGGIAHDFNNVLQTLSTAIQLIRLSEDPVRIQALTTTCEKAIERATVLTGQMRSFGKVQDVQLETVHLDQAITGAMPLLKNALRNDISLDVRSDEGLWPVVADRMQLELALLNVLINARDAMPLGGRVRIEMSNVVIDGRLLNLSPGNYVVISVSDNGAGMPPDVLSKALDPFFTTKSIAEGTGLGLPQVYGFATQAGGTLVLDSVEGEGTTVKIYLPQAAKEEADAMRDVQPGLHSARAGRLMFVEDDPLVREAMAPALASAGFDVVVAANGEEALHILESRGDITTVFSDIVMPGTISGVDLARIIRNRFPGVHVVLATGYSDTRIDIPGVRVLAKPYDIAEAAELLSHAA